MKQWIIRTLVKAWMPGYSLAPITKNIKTVDDFKQLVSEVLPGYHISRNPVREKKVYREVKMEDVMDMVVEMKKNERYADEI